MIKYRTTMGRIQAREVVRETDQSVYFVTHKGGPTRRELKHSGYANWHDTWVDAKRFLLAEAREGVDAALKALEKIDALEEPKCR